MCKFRAIHCKGISFSAAVAISLVGCGGGSNSTSSPALVAPSETQPAQPAERLNVLFVLEALSNSVAALPTKNPEAGPIQVDRLLKLPVQHQPLQMDYDSANDFLFVGLNGIIYVFDHASLATKSLNSLVSFSAGGNATVGVRYDTSRRFLYIVDRGSTVFAFSELSIKSRATEATFQFKLASPLKNQGHVDICGMALDLKNDMMYVGATWFDGGAGSAILVYDNASKRSGIVRPDRTIDASLSTSQGRLKCAMEVDSSRDTLYIPYGYDVGVLNNASSKQGKIVFDKLIQLPYRLSSIADLRVDQNEDRLYVVSQNNVTWIDKVSTASGFTLGKSATVPGSSDLRAIAFKQ